MHKADRVSGFFWLLFAVVVCVESYRMGLGNLRKPEPGFLFFWAGILLAVMSVIVQAQAWMGRAEPGLGKPFFAGNVVRKILPVLISVFLYIFLLEKLGFVIVTLLLFVFLLGVVEKKGWLMTLLTSFTVTVVAYLIFETALHSQLPKGLLESLRF